MENLKPPENTSPLRKKLVYHPHMTKSVAHPLRIKSLSLCKNFNLLKKKHSPPNDIITPSLKKSSI